jgi:hypothetical protein
MRVVKVLIIIDVCVWPKAWVITLMKSAKGANP